jgi:hypothetical protein
MLRWSVLALPRKTWLELPLMTFAADGFVPPMVVLSPGRCHSHWGPMSIHQQRPDEIALNRIGAAGTDTVGEPRHREAFDRVTASRDSEAELGVERLTTVQAHGDYCVVTRRKRIRVRSRAWL